ncbi:thiamine import ATP-binding protein ThiQ [Pseudosulfitobacter pseudonitzschiae]|uniref:Thiamine import ATP-binding protein ThiQ n=1 Tax=Pseudosulfitobacter pseudonitzschiae TaxID=1402135 RepID=A0A221K4A6_9RHOB|nr:ATP-binding cassette domain-containing protein [Sulfitobacter sp. DFL-23]ASM73795.1 thiamine import ATP-binding protein ThiQ [Pseudosulfitobacter pseudonitzschiae]
MLGEDVVLYLNDVLIELGDFNLRADLSVSAGRKVAIIGPSGAGKSTLVGAVAGFIPLVRGHVSMQGRDITQSSPDQRGMAMLFQDGNLFPHLTTAQNVGLGLRPALRLSADERRQVREALARVGLAGFEDRTPANLSGGQQSRAALARMLVQGKPLMLLDEPFAALGPALRDEMLDLVTEVAADTEAAVLMVTHAPQDVRRFADDVIFVEGGVAHVPQAAGALMDNPPPALKTYLG